MQSKDLLRANLEMSARRTLEHIEDMREHARVFPTPAGGCHTLWVLGHLAYIETEIIDDFMLGQPNPLAHWKRTFDGDEPSGDPNAYPPFDDVLAKCREVRRTTLARLEPLAEDDLDRVSLHGPKGWEDTFGTWRRCFQYVADHWHMHRGHLADARRAAGLKRMWV